MKGKIANRILLTLARTAFCICFVQTLSAAGITHTTELLKLGETTVKINIYRKEPAEITFFAPHYNERTGARVVRKVIAEKGGRLIEIESAAADGTPLRELKFHFRGRLYSVDPNRIYTANGRRCARFAPEAEALIADFAAALLQIIAPRERAENFPLTAIHNNQDSNEKPLPAQNRDLTAKAFVKPGSYDQQVRGVYLSNDEPDADNFIFLSNSDFLNFFAAKNFNVVIQKAADELFSNECAVDDGSLSVYFGQKNIPYINLEADAENGNLRQKEMLEAVYELIEKIKTEGGSEEKQ